MRLIMRCIASLLLATVASTSFGQSYPSKPVRVIVPLPPSGPLDAMARGLADSLSRGLGQPFMVDNRPGGDQIIAAEACARSAPDGYTLCAMGQTPVIVNKFLHANMPYNPERDFAPVGYIGTFVAVVVAHPKVPANDMRQFINLAKAKPGSVSWVTIGATSVSGMLLVWFRQNAGALLLDVAYKGTFDGFRDVLAGRVDSALIGVGTVTAQIKSGATKALAVSSAKRWPELPDVPTLKESGFDVPADLNAWQGLFAPAGTPPDILQRINAEMAKAGDDPVFRAKYYDGIGVQADDYRKATPAEFAAFIARNRAITTTILAGMGLTEK